MSAPFGGRIAPAKDTATEAELRQLLSMESDEEIADVIPTCSGEWRRPTRAEDEWIWCDAEDEAPSLSQALQDIAAERQRQQDVEGWTPEHDDRHDAGQLAHAAACYALSDLNVGAAAWLWPWSAQWWKPTTRRRDLVKAGALIAAEIERLDRAEAAKGSAP